MPRETETKPHPLHAAEQRIVARERLAETNRQRRDLVVEVEQLDDAVNRELYVAGQEGRQPKDIVEHRAALAEMRQRIADLEQLGRGQEAAVRDATGQRDAAMFAQAPRIERELLAEARRLEGERADRCTDRRPRRREESLRGRWRQLAAVVPGSDATFSEGAQSSPAACRPANVPAAARLHG